ncbi:methyltransferase domain-containing protein [Nevskia sp.]|uniref:class I SAM-dependent methyltransferase n=1 Tax=Nevskia sp. TaxID=1929292 RepID=UPI0025DCE145|nr:methyltransferase domain-containing protein [Nevskia sp.]
MHSAKPLHTYESQFSVTAPELVLPYVFSLVHPETVIDVGCGIATWSAVAKSLGCTVKGVDGPHVPVEKRLISSDEFVEIDLLDFKASGRFDLVICLEVVEHIPEAGADRFITALCSSADVILFSAAIPFQGGQNHVNEQWPIYWQSKFADHGFRMLDVLRQHFWQESRINWWYRQNMFLVCKNDHPLASGSREFDGSSFIHPELFLLKAASASGRRRGLKRLLSFFKPASRSIH